MKHDKASLCIVLASFNGAEYIGDQIDSLLTQTYTKWKLFIRDDGSDDDTVSIINKYAAKDIRINIVQDNYKNLGSCQNFAKLLSFTASEFQYFMFCDQDDFWLPFKIQDTLSEMQLLEKQQDKEAPLLVYTNFQYADNNLKIIKSKKDYEATKVSKLRFAHLLAQNPAYGCTMMVNKKLAELIATIPFEAENHDYWAALTASVLGEIAYLQKKTIYYRQHNNNISTNYDSNSIVKRFKRIFLQRENFEDVRRKIAMAIAFKDSYFSQMKDADKKILNEFISFGKGRTLSMLLENIKNGVRRQTFSQTFLFYTTILSLKRK